MADNITVTPGVGATISAKEIAGAVKVQRMLAQYGGAGTAATDVSETEPLPTAKTRVSSTTTTAVALSLTAVTVVGANTARRGLFIYNNSTQTACLKLGSG